MTGRKLPSWREQVRSWLTGRIPAERIARLVGKYRIDSLGLEGGALMGQAAGQGAFRLRWQGGDEFRATTVRIVFAADAASFTLFQGGGEFQTPRVE